MAAYLSPLDPLDRTAVVYLALPLVIFLLGWFEPWAALPLLACVGYALRPAVVPAGVVPAAGAAGAAGAPGAGRTTARPPITRLQLGVAVAVGCAWTLLGGTGHWVFANADWHVRDAVLHDLVAGHWPLGYGPSEGRPTLLRAPLGFYLPAALVGKWAGLTAAHAALGAYTALGATLFLLQALSLTPSRAGMAVLVAAVVVLFSGFDIIGSLCNDPRFIEHWDIARHLEWWAGRYQYSSLTTQLFWVPNHALGGWLVIGLLYRAAPLAALDGMLPALDAMLPMIIVAVLLWSPLAALGLVPFALRRACAVMLRARSLRLLDPRIVGPALLVGAVVAAYLTLDAGRIPRGWTFGRHGTDALHLAADLYRQMEFFLLEAGCLGIAVLAIRRSSEVVLALALLALLPLVSFGAANDLVMRASIPSLAVLAIGACVALAARHADRPDAPPPAGRGLRVRQAILLGLLAVGAVTPVAEIARAAVLDPWPIDRDATLIDAACGRFPAHYIARLGEPGSQALIVQLLARVAVLPREPRAAAERACENPALTRMKARGLL